MSTQNRLEETFVRDEIIRAIDILLDQPDQSDEAHRILDFLHQHFLEKEHIFSLGSIVYHPFVGMIRSTEFQADRVALSTFRARLLGQIPHWNTYALRHNFVGLLKGKALEAYEKMVRFLTVFRGRLGQSDIGASESEEYEGLRDALYDLCYEQIRPYTIGEFLTAQACHILLGLPEDGSRYFDTLGVFKGIYPDSTIVSKDDLLDYVESLVRKLGGEAVLFVDIHTVSGGFVISWR